MRAQRVELERAIAQGRIVVVCWEPGCPMHRLPHWEDGQWVARPLEKGYRNYSHSICGSHYRLYQEQMQRFMAEEAAALGAGLGKSAAA
jgi:hypothetical protein